MARWSSAARRRIELARRRGPAEHAIPDLVDARGVLLPGTRDGVLEEGHIGLPLLPGDAAGMVDSIEVRGGAPTRGEAEGREDLVSLGVSLRATISSLIGRGTTSWNNAA